MFLVIVLSRSYVAHDIELADAGLAVSEYGLVMDPVVRALALATALAPAELGLVVSEGTASTAMTSQVRGAHLGEAEVGLRPDLGDVVGEGAVLSLLACVVLEEPAHAGLEQASACERFLSALFPRAPGE